MDERLQLDLTKVPRLHLPDGFPVWDARDQLKGSIVQGEAGGSLVWCPTEGDGHVHSLDASWTGSLVPPEDDRDRDGLQDLVLALARDAGLDAPKGCRAEVLLFWNGGTVLVLRDGSNKWKAWTPGMTTDLKPGDCPALAVIDPALPDAVRLAVLVVVRQVFGVTHG